VHLCHPGLASPEFGSSSPEAQAAKAQWQAVRAKGKQSASIDRINIAHGAPCFLIRIHTTPFVSLGCGVCCPRCARPRNVAGHQFLERPPLPHVWCRVECVHRAPLGALILLRYVSPHALAYLLSSPVPTIPPWTYVPPGHRLCEVFMRLGQPAKVRHGIPGFDWRHISVRVCLPLVSELSN